jgi:hypothetical protein
MKIVLGLLGTLALVKMVGCSEVAARVIPPVPIIVAQNGVDGFAGLDYVGNVSCTVRNKGGMGSARVTATFMQDGSWTRSQTIFLGPGEERDVTFVFPEAKAFSSHAMRFTCSAS